MPGALARESPERRATSAGPVSSLEEVRAERVAIRVLAAAMALSAATIVFLGRSLTFWSDELDWLTGLDGFAPKTLLIPHNGHLIALPRLLYELLPRLFGADYLPFRLLSAAAVLSCCALFFVLVRRRLGGPVALAPTLVLLFFGTSSEVVLSPLGLVITLSVGFGLAAFVAVEMDHRRGDVAACVVLTLAILSETFGTIIAGGVAIYLLLDPCRRRRIWIAAIPILLWAAWWVWAQRFDQEIAMASNLPGVPSFVVESAAASLAAITGVGKSFGSGSEGVEVVVKAVFIAMTFAGIVLLGLRIRRAGSGPALWPYVATVLAFWVGTALAASDERQPTTPRYVFFGAIMVMLIVAEAIRGERLRGGAMKGVVIFFAACVAANAIRLAYGADGLTDRARAVGSQVAMIELAGGAAQPTVSPRSIGPPASRDVASPASAINGFAERYGPIGMSLDEVRDQSDRLRENADLVLSRALGLVAIPTTKSLRGATSHCRDFGGDPAEPERFALPPGIHLIRVVSGPSQTLPLGRFGDQPTVPVGELVQGQSAVIGLPSDAAPDRWFAEARSQVEVCDLAAGAPPTEGV